MIKHIFAVAAIAVALLAPARADYVIKDGNGVVKTIKAGTVSGTILPYSSPTDSTGIPYSAANPLAVMFGTGVTLPSFATPQHFICDSGCSGGGGGGLSVPFAGAIGANGTPVGFKDGSGNLQPLLGDVTNGQWVSIKASVPIAVTGTFFQATQPVSAASLPLPSGAATSAAQTTGNASLSSIDGKTPALGQALAAASVPIVLTASQLTTLTPPAAISGFGTAANQATIISSLATLNAAVAGPIAAGSSIIGKVGIDQTTPGTTNGVQDAATGSTGATAPTKAIEIAGIAQNAEAAAATTGQLKGVAADLVGKQIMLPYANPENLLAGQITAAMTATTSTALTGMGAQGGSFRVYVTGCTFSNSHAAVGTMINLQDGSGGTVLWQAPAAAVYGGAQVTFPTPIKTTANTGLFAVNATTGANTFVSCTGYKGI